MMASTSTPIIAPMTFSKGTVKKSCTLDDGEKLSCVLALGYGATEGVPHKSKPMETLCKTDRSMTIT